MSTYDTDLDSINNICSLVGEIVELSDEIGKDNIKKCKDLIKSKALTIKDKAQKMEDRLKIYRKSIESMGFKRTKKR